jgi:peptidyl-dipeptidase Dcp
MDRARLPDELTAWSGPHGLPRFDAIAESDFAPAIEAAMAGHLRQIEAIAADPRPADFGNTIAALELAGRDLSRVSAVFFLRAGALTNDAIRATERQVAPLLARHHSAIGQNAALFARVDRLWQARGSLGLSAEQARVLEKRWKAFRRAGAALPEDGKRELSAINERLALLGAKFGQNVLADESSWSLPLTDPADLAGLPADLVGAMEAAARDRGIEAGAVVTLSRSIVEPFLTYSPRRPLREAAFKAWTARGEGQNDNRPVVAEMLDLRARKAALLGYRDYADYKLEDSMAATAQAVDGLLAPVWQSALKAAESVGGELTGLIAAEGGNHTLEAWDWRYYAEKRRQARFDLSEDEVKAYLSLDNVIAAAFEVARRLFGIAMRPLPDAPVWQEDVRAFEVLEGERRIGLFFGDYFARTSKRSGAWMSQLQEQRRLGGRQLPVIYNVMNFARPRAGEPCLLSMNDARTLFHEFGHALHGLLSDVEHPSLAGTAVARDFVELPSQLYEHWLTTPQILSRYARHHETGAPMPAGLIERVKRARNANSAFETVEFTASALVDMAFHTQWRPGVDPMAFEAETLASLRMPDAIVMRHRTPHFAHVFAGDGYAAGYYSYLWSEVLDADAFAAFEATGDAFDPETAARLKRCIYAAGGAPKPDRAYLAFRGRLPSPEAMMKGRGLT